MPEIQKVTAPNKIVTDPVLLSTLEKQGIDKDYVEFWHDYALRSKGAEYSPYTKFYRDLKSDKRIVVSSGLPMVDAFGNHHELIWRGNRGVTENGNNIFHCILSNGSIRLITLSDQPTGAKKDSEITYHPQLFFNGVGVQPISLIPKLLDTDPVNENYHYNVLEWDYGICKRRIRIIEGRFRERWVFSANPNGSVRIKHNSIGKLKFGYASDAKGFPLRVIVIGDEEVIGAAEFNRPDIDYPVQIGASVTYYPEAHPETASVDGYVGRAGQSETWAALRTGAGTYTDDGSSIYVCCFHVARSNITDRWQTIYRGIALFDTEGLPDNAVVTAAVVSLYGYNDVDCFPEALAINVYASTPASNIALVAADYQQVGGDPYCDTPVGHGWSLIGYNDFTLNTTGRAAVSKTDVTKLGFRDATCDVSGDAPTWPGSDSHEYMYGYSADKGNGFKPKLVVTYYVITGRHGFVNFQDPGIV